MRIIIPFKTPSVNHLYGHTRYGGLFLKKEAKELRERIKALCNSSEALNLQYEKLKVSIEIHENWRYKNGQLRKSDVSNREKFLVDSVFEGLNLDDKWIFELKLTKKENNKEFAIIQIEAVEEV